jgi:hypothetical protein
LVILKYGPSALVATQKSKFFLLLHGDVHAWVHGMFSKHFQRKDLNFMNTTSGITCSDISIAAFGLYQDSWMRSKNRYARPLETDEYWATCAWLLGRHTCHGICYQQHWKLLVSNMVASAPEYGKYAEVLAKQVNPEVPARP